MGEAAGANAVSTSPELFATFRAATVIATLNDPDGKQVELTAERWAHIVHPDSHPKMAEDQGDVLRAIEHPTE